MNYDEAIEWLYRSQWFGIKLGLDETTKLLDHLGKPQNRYPSIHVAGTNGKGSVCAFSSQILRRRFSKVALFTSPHLVDFRERMTLNGKWADTQHIADILTRIRKIAESENANFTFFKITTALAFTLFAENEVDIAVIETGMGGALDCTNVLAPRASAITTVSYDHMQWLGSDIASIAREKAGIIKSKTPIFTTVEDPVALDVIKKQAVRMQAPFQKISAPYEDGPIGLAGEHQAWNAALAVALCRNIEPSFQQLPESAISEAIAATTWPGRFQKIFFSEGEGTLILDGAHNPSAICRLVKTWKSQFGNRRANIIFGSLADKKWEENIRLLGEIAERFYFVPVRSPRSLSSQELLEKTKKISGAATSLAEALKHARQSKTPYLLTGSLFLVGEALSILKKSEPPLDSTQ
ncbi:MAG: bifunctional folylpolyglutamate synthase/dihydrofolate synthase [Chthoniobacterales bacterium]